MARRHAMCRVIVADDGGLPMAERFEGPLATHFGSYYPTGYVVGVLDDSRHAEEATQALRAAGCDAGEVRVFTGEQVQAIERQFLHQRTLAQRVGEAIASDEGEAHQQYLEAARRGHAFVTAHAPHLDEARRVATILTQHRGHGVRHYGAAVMTELVPPRNWDDDPTRPTAHDSPTSTPRPR